MLPMSDNNLRIGVIGCGGIASAHVAGYGEAGATITAVADTNGAAADNLAASLPGAKAFAESQALLESGLVDAVSICTPPACHEGAALAALSQGIHVLCEKPLAHTPEAARLICKAAQRGEAILMTAFRHRFLPAIVAMRQHIEGGTIGTPVHLQNTFCGPAFNMQERWFSKRSIAGGGCLMDTSSHSVDLFRFLLGEVVEQQAVMHQHFPNTDVEDAAILTVKSQTGALGTLCATWVAGCGVATLEVMGKSGRLLYDYAKPETLLLFKPGETEPTAITVAASSGFSEEVAQFLGAIAGTCEASPSGTDGLRAVEIIHGVYGDG